jgi:hypothetical protein
MSLKPGGHIPTPPTALHGRALLAALAEAGVIAVGDRVARVVIDAPVDGLAVIHVQRAADTRLLEVVPTLGGIEIRESPRPAVAPAAFQSRAVVRLAEIAGLDLTEGEAGVLNRMCAQSEDGRWYERELRFNAPDSGGESSARRILAARALAGLFLYRERTIVWLSPTPRFAASALQLMSTLVRAESNLSAQVKRVSAASGDQAITLNSGQQLRFLTLRGMRGVRSDAILCEGVVPWNEVHPSLATADNPQLVNGCW